MSEWKDKVADSQERWEENAGFWDDYMGEESNSFHREIVRPSTEELLELRPGDKVLDISCGNGNFSRRLVDLGTTVVAFDFSPTMIERAKKRSSKYQDRIDYHVLDATDFEGLLTLGENQFNKAVANMALMDIAVIDPLMKALNRLLKPGGCFVFSVMHPCFQTPGDRKVYEEEEVDNDIVARRGVYTFNYIKPQTFTGVSVRNQPTASRYFHRPLSVLLGAAFTNGLVMDGIAEPTFDAEKYQASRFEWIDIPPVIILRLRKQK